MDSSCERTGAMGASCSRSRRTANYDWRPVTTSANTVSISSPTELIATIEPTAMIAARSEYRSGPGPLPHERNERTDSSFLLSMRGSVELHRNRPRGSPAMSPTLVGELFEHSSDANCSLLTN